REPDGKRPSAAASGHDGHDVDPACCRDSHLTQRAMTALTSTTARPLPLQMRPDLVVRRQRWQGREYWTVKDPLTLKYYRFEAEEFAILSLLDGRISSDSIREQFGAQFPPQRLSSAQLQHLLA